MTNAQLRRLAERAERAAQALRVAAIDLDAAVSTYQPTARQGSNRLRSFAELMPSLALDAARDVISLDDP